MKCNDVRKLALSLPEATEEDHWGRPSFRVRGKIFATLWPKEERAVVKLARDHQEMLFSTMPKVFTTISRQQGWTFVELKAIDAVTLKSVLTTAWRNVAPKRLADGGVGTVKPKPAAKPKAKTAVKRKASS
jgi:hypothetical protein